MSGASAGSGPGTHYELFCGLRNAGVAYLVTGATALALHGVPRLTPDVDLVVDPDPANLTRLTSLLAAWGYGETPPAGRPGGAAVRRFRHPQSALGMIDVVCVPPAAFARLRAGAAAAPLVDLEIPLVGAADLQALKNSAAAAADREDAAALETLASIRAGETGSDADTRREQIRKFSRWSVAARLDWLLAAARLSRGLSPEAKPMTRGLVRRNPWTQRRG
jgi:CheY-like chemotaxis protein